MKTVVLSGFPGTGKTTVGPLVAARLGVAFVDVDEALAAKHGKAVADLWAAVGEGGFRELEGALIRELLEDGVARVLAFGGGAVTTREVRHLALDRAFVATLTARPETLAGRVGDAARRPSLASGDVPARIAALLEQRAEAYAECHAAVATDGLTPAEAASRVAEAAEERSVVVALGRRTYRVEVVEDAPAALARAVARLEPSSVLVVSDANVMAARGRALEASLGPLGVSSTVVTLPPGEENKTLASVQAIWTAAIAAKVDRRSVLVGFGGGVVGDLAGFAASTLLRGLRVVQAPTSLLAMVDASVGGKTGFDLPDGKNLIGSFHQPAAVVLDLAHLATLPVRELRAGLAEVVKVALAFDEALWDGLEHAADALATGDRTALGPLVLRAVARKAQVVRGDELDTGARALLNLGHTVGHALEAAGGYRRYLHGEAVALGLLAECAAAERLGLATPALTERLRVLTGRLGLPTELPPDELSRAWPLAALDKKRVGEEISLPIADAVGRARLVTLTLADLAAALRVAAVAAPR